MTKKVKKNNVYIFVILCFFLFNACESHVKTGENDKQNQEKFITDTSKVVDGESTSRYDTLEVVVGESKLCETDFKIYVFLDILATDSTSENVYVVNLKANELDLKTIKLPEYTFLESVVIDNEGFEIKISWGSRYECDYNFEFVCIEKEFYLKKLYKKRHDKKEEEPDENTVEKLHVKLKDFEMDKYIK